VDLLTANDRPGHYPDSYYAATAPLLDAFPPAASLPQEARRADVAIVGAGYAGLSAALCLAEAGYDVIVLEANRVGAGASGRNGGQVGPGQRVDQVSLEGMVGASKARALWQVGLSALEEVTSRCATHQIDAEWQPGVIEAAHRPRFVSEFEEYAAHMGQHYGHELEVLDREGIQAHVGSPGYHGGLLDRQAGHLHPLKYLLGLARAAVAAGVRIHEGSRVLDITPGTGVQLEGADIAASHVLVCANGYLGSLLPGPAARTMPINNFIAATEPLSLDFARSLIRDNHAVADTRFVINYFRLSQDLRMLFGGGESYGWTFPRDIAAKVRRPMLEVYPQLADTRIDYAWGGTLGITMSRLPHFTRVGKDVLSVGGFSGHGVALATLAGRMAAEAIRGQAERFDLMASLPTPRFPGGRALRHPLLVAGMVWYALRDKL
jgi:gamma-glutamylputrescine oxidase